MTKVERWERRTEIPFLLLALAFLVAYARQVLDPRMPTGLQGYLVAVSWFVWAVLCWTSPLDCSWPRSEVATPRVTGTT